MKKYKRLFCAGLSLLMLGSLVPCAASAEAELSEAEKAQLLEDAYIFTLPLMMVDATVTAATNTVEVTEQKAPANQFIHAAALATAEFKNVVTPNVDTIYSQLMLDLSGDAVIMELPRTERFCTAQLIDAYTNCVRVIDASAFEADSCRFILTGPGFEGEIPEGMEQIKYPSSMGWIIIRTICYDKADETAVHEIQSQMSACTLSQYEAGTVGEAVKGSYDERNDFIPSQWVMSLPMDEYFSRANALMAENPPTAEDAPMMAELAKINVGPGLDFDSGIFGAEADALWQKVTGGVLDSTSQSALRFFTQSGNWSYMGEPIAEFGTEYDYRAFIAIFGLGANPVSVAVYPKTDVDSDGGRLHGDNCYVLHFDKGGLPPTEGYGFWSVTAYTSKDNFLIDNQIDRYCINNRSDVVYNEDGSLDILIQAERPEENEANWLPVVGEEFHLVMRIYMPADSVVENTWPTPVLSKTE